MRSGKLRWWRLGTGAAAAVVVALVGCSGGGTPAASTASGGPAQGAAQGSAPPGASAQVGAHDIPKGGKVQSPKLIDRQSRSGLAADHLDTVRSKPKLPKTSQELYQAVAPATVVIRVPNGIGSGVIIDRAGWILTNHHVIVHGKTEQFQVSAQVVLGSLSAQTGGMERSKTEYEALVYKSDKLRDLALLKLKSPPPNLPTVSVAKKNPTPGQPVVAIGHAGAGMLWALKNGEVSALGKLSEHLAQLARFGADEESAAKEFREFLDSQYLGLVIQSTCNILPGDSGGPLVNRAGELIGLNAFGRQDRGTGGMVSFHVHVEEIRKFVADKPKKPSRLVPNPWTDGGGDATYEDADLDGRVDVLFMQGRRPCFTCPRQSSAIFVDADQDSYIDRALPELTETFANRDFDAELVALQAEQDMLFWYDSDNDSRFDLLLVDRNTDGTVDEGYRIAADEDLSADEQLAGGLPVRGALLTDPALRARLDRVAAAVFPTRYVGTSTSLATSLPSPLPAAGRGEKQDLDQDGNPDSLLVSNTFSTRLLVDVTGSFIGQLPDAAPIDQYATAGKLDAEIAIVSQGTHIWVWYDTDDDRKFDLVLHAPGSRVYAATDAYRVDGAGQRTALPEAVGRKMVRPALLAAPAQQQTLYALVQKKRLTSLMSALDNDGLGSFPDPVADHRSAGFSHVSLAKAKKALVTASGTGSEGYLMDLDQSTWRFKPMKGVDVAADVSGGKFDAEVAVFKRNGVAWVFYDTDRKAGYDLVLVSTQPATGKATQGYRIDTKGQVTLDRTFAGRPLIIPSLFQQAKLKQTLDYVAREIFVERMIESP